MGFGTGCGSGSKCPAVDAEFFGCTDPNDCLAVITTWNFPGADGMPTADLDLSLNLPGGGLVDYNDLSEANCVHQGDNEATELVPTSEAIVCDMPYLEGEYDFHWFTLFDIPVRVDVNDNGVTSRSNQGGSGDVLLS